MADTEHLESNEQTIENSSQLTAEEEVQQLVTQILNKDREIKNSHGGTTS